MAADVAPASGAPPRGVGLGAFDVGCVVVGGIIGVGIFFTPRQVAAAVDQPAQVVVAWSLGGAMALLGALVFARLSTLVPGHGGTFLYIERALGRLPAFLYGWANWLVIQAGALGVIGLVMADYLDAALHGASTWSADAKVGLAAAATLGFTLLNALGLAVGKRIQNALTVAKVAAIGMLVALALFGQAAAPPPAPPSPPVERGWAVALAGALLPVLFSFGGWQQGSFLAGAARRPHRDVPLGILGGVTVVVVAYVAVNLAYLKLLGLQGAAHSEAIAEAATRAALAGYGLGDAAARLLSAMVVVSALGIMNTICLAPPFVLHAMASRGLFFESVGRLHPRSGAPVIGVLVQGTWGTVLLLGSHLLLREHSRSVLEFLLTGIVFVDWLFYGACGAALLRLRGVASRAALPAALFALAAAAVAIGAVCSHPEPSLWGLVLCAAGLPCYHWLRRRGARGGGGWTSS